MAGNGIRKDIWKQFQETFKIEQIVEFYGSTEGNANLGKIIYCNIILLLSVESIYI